MNGYSLHHLLLDFYVRRKVAKNIFCLVFFFQILTFSILCICKFSTVRSDYYFYTTISRDLYQVSFCVESSSLGTYAHSYKFNQSV